MRRLVFAVVLLVSVAASSFSPPSSSLLVVEAAVARVCPPGVPTAFCFADPCRANDCALGCESDYCGGCYARCRCRRDTDCTGGERCKRDEAAAATGLCMPTTTGSPAAPDDSNNKNEGATVDKKCMTVRCNSDTTCVKGACVPRKCSTNSDCSERAFCSTEGKCLSRGSCVVPADCPAQGWLPMIKCIGHFTCEEGQCGYACGRIIPPGRGRGRGRGLGLGVGGDLGRLGNESPQHPQETDEAAATSTSTTPVTTTTSPPYSSSPPAASEGAEEQHDRAPPPSSSGCQSNDECDARSYCGSRGTCVQRGQCDVPADCPHDPSFVHIMCAPGIFACTADRQCGYHCGTTLSP